MSTLETELIYQLPAICRDNAFENYVLALFFFSPDVPTQISAWQAQHYLFQWLYFCKQLREFQFSVHKPVLLNDLNIVKKCPRKIQIHSRVRRFRKKF